MFCRNVIPVKKRLSARDVRLPLTCPMCVKDIEHMTHLFFIVILLLDVEIMLTYDWSVGEYASEWLFSKISIEMTEVAAKLYVTLWGIWRGRNKKVWKWKDVSPAFAMISSFQFYSEWIEARNHK